MRLYFEGVEKAEDIVAFIRLELNLIPRWNVLFELRGVKMYLDSKAFGQKKREYERNGDKQGEDGVRYAADVKALLRITKGLGSEASLQVVFGKG